MSNKCLVGKVLSQKKKISWKCIKTEKKNLVGKVFCQKKKLSWKSILSEKFLVGKLFCPNRPLRGAADGLAV